MVSTTPENDYVHLIVKRLAEDSGKNINWSTLSMADFERTFTTKEFDYSQLSSLENSNPDYVIIQIGENVSDDDINNYTEIFEKKYCELLYHFSNSKRIICIPFWPDKRKAIAVTNVALNTKSHLVDLSHLGGAVLVKTGNYFDIKNLADYQKNYKQPGVGIHPGDYGMQSIADAIYTAIQAE